MVLIFIICLLGAVQSIDPPLISKYSKEVRKAIKKEFGLTDYQLVPESNSKLTSLKNGESLTGYLFVSEVAACHLGGCVPNYDASSELIDNEVSLGSEYFDVLVVLTPEKEIKKIKILNYFSDYGYEVTSKNYLKKFQGKTVCDFYSGSDEIDAISGATISSMALEGILGELCE